MGILNLKSQYGVNAKNLFVAGSGDTICFRGGTYRVTDSQVMKTERNYAFVFALEKGGSASHLTCLMGYPGERPVFDCSALQLDGQHRFAVFYLGATICTCGTLTSSVCL